MLENVLYFKSVLLKNFTYLEGNLVGDGVRLNLLTTNNLAVILINGETKAWLETKIRYLLIVIEILIN